MKLVLLLFLLTLCSSQLPLNDTNSNTCIPRLIDRSKFLSDAEYNELCDILNKYPLFMIRLRREIDYAIQGAVFFEASSFKYFDTECNKYTDMCQFGFLIDIYVDDKIIIIQPGSKSKLLVNDVYRKRTIASVRPELLKGKWHKALHKILTLIIYKEQGGKTRFFIPFSKDPKNFLFFILVPLMVIGFIGMTTFLYYMSKGYFNNDVYEFLDNIIRLWGEISDSEEKRIKLEKYTCIFCWKKTTNEREVFMYCGHSYHEKCLRKWRLYQYRCCPCSYEAIKEVEEKNKGKEKPTYITIEDLKILLGLCLDAFRKEYLYDYFVENEKKINEFNEQYGVSLEELCWLYQNKLHNYKTYRIFYKMYKVWKMTCFILAFYPKFLKSKKVKLITKLLKVKQRGATVEKLD